MNNFRQSHQGLVSSLGLLAGIVVIVLVVYLFGIFNTTMPTIDFGEEVFSMSYGGEEILEFDREEILDVEVIATLRPGDAVDAVTQRKYMVGTWENEEWGEYTLCIQQSVGEFIVVTTETDVYVLNLESEETTEAIAETLVNW